MTTSAKHIEQNKFTLPENVELIFCGKEAPTGEPNPIENGNDKNRNDQNGKCAGGLWTSPFNPESGQCHWQDYVSCSNFRATKYPKSWEDKSWFEFFNHE
jgi:hypothetical protein